MVTTFSNRTIEPVDLLGGAKTIPLGKISTCEWLADWIPATDFSEWGRRSLKEDCLYGWVNAISHAKRAVGCRIDILLHYNHLAPFFSKTYPEKIDALKQLGISISNSVYQFAISPRNALEHKYERPTRDFAEYAVDIAGSSGLSVGMNLAKETPP